jgi:DNA-binding transcriptional LysR family regulator
MNREPLGPLLRDLDLNLVRALHALLHEDSVSRAADSLGITQAAASNALRRLRVHFNDELRVRRGAVMERTLLATTLQPLAAAAMWAISRALEEPRAFDPLRAEGVLRVATSDHVEAVLLEPLARVLRKAAPGVKLRVEPFVANAGERLLGGELEFVLAPQPSFPEALRASKLFEEPYLAVLRKQHPVLRAGLSLKRFAALEHIAVSPTGGRAFAVDTALAAVGYTRNVVRVVSGFSQAVLLVAESDLIAVLPRSFAERFADRLRLVLVAPPLRLPPSRIDVGWSPSRHSDPLLVWARQQMSQSANGLASATALTPKKPLPKRTKGSG